MIEASVLPWASLGVGGILAGIMFYFYRQDRMDTRERWANLVADLNRQSDERLVVMKGMHDEMISEAAENRRIQQQLSQLIRSRMGSMSS